MQLENKFLVCHNLASNTPLAQHVDMEDDFLAQVFCIMAGQTSKEQMKYKQALLLTLKSNESLYKILKDEYLCEIGVHLSAWQHFHGLKSGGGLTCIIYHHGAHILMGCIILSLSSQHQPQTLTKFKTADVQFE